MMIFSDTRSILGSLATGPFVPWAKALFCEHHRVPATTVVGTAVFWSERSSF